MTIRPPFRSWTWNPAVRPKLLVGLLVAMAPVLFGACGQTLPEEAPPEDVTAAESAEPEVTAIPLKVIMAGLATDMAGTAMGIWSEDAPAVAEWADGIANHPRVPPEQMAAIQAELGQEFGDFVAFDQLVHGRAVELREGALAAQPTPELVSTFAQVAEGCVACHTAFRERISSALANAEQGG